MRRKSSLLPGERAGMLIPSRREAHGCPLLLLPAAAACCCPLLWRRQERGCPLVIPLPPATCCQHGFTALLKVLLVPGTDPGLLPWPNCQVAHKPE